MLLEVLDPCVLPGSEESCFTVVAIVGQIHLGTDEDDLAVVYEDPAVVPYCLMQHRGTNVEENVVTQVIGMLEDLADDLP